METKRIVQGFGFNLLYADTDSVFLQKTGATIEEFESVKDALAKETGLPITLECYYKFLVLLPPQADDVSIEASKVDLPANPIRIDKPVAIPLIDLALSCHRNSCNLELKR
jgi:hypothetical protein